jgi:hypothetical protein
MNDAQHEALSTYLRSLADRLLLADWEITLRRETADDDCFAQVKVWSCENQANVRVSDDFWHGPPEDQREWLVHELGHCHLDRPERVMEQLAEQFSDNSASVFAKEAHRKEIEICVQRLARIIAPFMPLPPEVTRP